MGAAGDQVGWGYATTFSMLRRRMDGTGGAATTGVRYWLKYVALGRGELPGKMHRNDTPGNDFELQPDGTVTHRLKNYNHDTRRVWRYQHWHSYSPKKVRKR